MSDVGAGEGALTDTAKLELQEKAWQAFNERDWDLFFSLATEDTVIRSDPGWPGGGEFIGREEIMRFTDQFLEPWRDLRYQRVGEPTLINGRVVERGSWVGTGRTTGIESSVEFSLVGTFSGGRLARSDFFISERHALEFARRK